MKQQFNLNVEPFGALAEYEEAVREDEETRGRRFASRPVASLQKPRHSRAPKQPLRPFRPCRTTGCRPAVFGGHTFIGVHSTDGNELIRWLQNALNELMGLRLPLDGVAGTETRSAIRSFQRRQGLPVTGFVDPDTERAVVAGTSIRPPSNDDRREPQQEFGVSALEFEGDAGRNRPEYNRWLQQSLNRVSKAGLVVDGGMGARTRYALRRFQSSAGLNGDGSPDSQTEAALVKAGASPPPGSSPASSGSQQAPSTPRLLKQETQPAQRTVYVEIDLKNIHRRTNKPVNPMTGIFIPDRFTQSPEVDLILYLHGFDLAGCNKAIETYWKTACQPHFPLREGVNDSGKNVVLVAPTLGSKSEAGNLTKSGALDDYLDRVMAGLKAHAAHPGMPRVGNIILACHSGGGLPMRQIAQANNRYGSRIRECWGFDCTYNSGDAVLWAQWAKRNPQSRVYIYYIPGEKSGTKAQAESLKRMNLPNVVVERSSKSHNWVPITFWKTRIQGAPFLKNR